MKTPRRSQEESDGSERICILRYAVLAFLEKSSRYDPPALPQIFFLDTVLVHYDRAMTKDSTGMYV